MRFKSSFHLKKNLSVLLHSESGAPYAVRIDVRRIYSLLTMLSGLFFLFFMGSILFFRELESTRKLEQRVLELEIAQKLAQDTEYSSLLLKSKASASPARLVSSKEKPQTSIQKAVVAQPTPKPAVKPKVKVESKPKREVRQLAAVRTRISQLSASCLEVKCSINIGLLPTGPGVAEGGLVVILETEFSRIGTSLPDAEARKKYHIYPLGEVRDELSQTEVTKFKGSPYRFYKGLRKNVSFKIAKLERPVAASAYLLGKNGNIMHSLRKSIVLEP